MNSIGRVFRVSVFGESHGEKVGVTIDAPIAGLDIDTSDFNADLARRKSGAKGTTPRKESDIPFIASGVFSGHATGAPITILFDNENTLSGDYRNLVTHPRPGHSDFVASQKYKGYNDYRGGGHFSARVTLGIVAAGVVAKKILSKHGIKVSASIAEIAGESDSSKFETIIASAIKKQDSVGGVVECVVDGVKVGLGEPFFDSVESLISHAIFSIPAVRGIEFGDGFASSRSTGSSHNDMIMDMSGKTSTNHSGGVNGGITNGNQIVFRTAFKPTSSISSKQQTLNIESGIVEELIVKGRHDACVALRAPVIVEAMASIIIADLILLQK
ncbi:MAG: chorismate synthase [Rikenellaceae bacterium]